MIMRKIMIGRQIFVDRSFKLDPEQEKVDEG